MESGQYVYCDDYGHQHQGVMGCHQAHEDQWRSEHVWLLIDGKVNDVFLSKISNVCVFYHAPLKTTNARRLVPSPWKKEELTEFLANTDKDELCRQMQPYLTYLDQKVLKVKSIAGGSNMDVDEDAEDIAISESACILAYDEVSAWAQVDKTDSNKVMEFLINPCHHRFELIGGRIRLILNPSITFATLKYELSKALRGFRSNIWRRWTC